MTNKAPETPVFRELCLCPKTGFSLIFSLIGSTGGNCTDKTLHAVDTLLVPGQYAATWGNMPCSDGAVADTRPLNSAAEGSAGVL